MQVAYLACDTKLLALRVVFCFGNPVVISDAIFLRRTIFNSRDYDDEQASAGG